MIFLGHLNRPELVAGVGIGNLYIIATWLSVSFGLNGALETLTAQAYGAKNLQLCGVYLNRSRFIMICFCIPMSFLWFQAEKVLLFIGQNPAVCANA
jgi:MATE family multidrug resistance protein